MTDPVLASDGAQKRPPTITRARRDGHSLFLEGDSPERFSLEVDLREVVYHRNLAVVLAGAKFTPGGFLSLAGELRPVESFESLILDAVEVVDARGFATTEIFGRPASDKRVTGLPDLAICSPRVQLDTNTLVGKLAICLMIRLFNPLDLFIQRIFRRKPD